MMVAHARLTRILDEDLRNQTDLDLRGYDALLHIYEAGDSGVRMADLAYKVVLSRSGLTTLVDRLEEKGLVRRIPDPDDRRSTRVALTEPGIETFKRAAKTHMQGIDAVFGDRIGADEAEVLARVLGRFTESV